MGQRFCICMQSVVEMVKAQQQSRLKSHVFLCFCHTLDVPPIGATIRRVIALPFVGQL